MKEIEACFKKVLQTSCPNILRQVLSNFWGKVNFNIKQTHPEKIKTHNILQHILEG